MSRQILSGIVAILLCTGPASATVTVPAGFREIVADATLIVRGHVTDVQNAGFSATCSTASGLRRSVKASWEIDDSSTISEGVISVNPA